MMTILRNRADMAHALEEEAQDPTRQKHVSTVVVKEIIRAQARGWNAARISKEYKLDPSVVERLGNYVAIPVDNEEGVVCSRFIRH